jgi:cysteine synthase
MATMGLEREIVDPQVLQNTIQRFARAGILLPTFAQLADPALIPERVERALEEIDPDAAHPLNLFRVHWYNDAERRGRVALPAHVVLPKSLTGVEAPIVLLIGDRFPMIGAHKVLAAYSCLVPRLVTGQFDPTAHRALWPSTGNYCRGGVAISRIMDCRGIAILPEGMSRERFDWLESWVCDAGDDIIRTVGVESNVKEIYDKCAELEVDPHNVIFNQFSEFANHLGHYWCTGRACEHIFETLRADNPALNLELFVSATGSAGTIAAGDYLKERHGSRIVAAEALECPTILYNGFGDHNIQGIGDKHIPLIHNVMNSDFAVAISDEDTDSLGVLFNDPVGHAYLRERRGVPEETIAALGQLGISSICNVLASIKMARKLRLGPNDAIFTIATDGWSMYTSEQRIALDKRFGGRFDTVSAGETYARFILGQGIDHLREMTFEERNRVFNLGYFTWVEQQGIAIEEFEARRQRRFWSDLHALVPIWDRLIEQVNSATGVLETL